MKRVFQNRRLDVQICISQVIGKFYTNEILNLQCCNRKEGIRCLMILGKISWCSEVTLLLSIIACFTLQISRSAWIYITHWFKCSQRDAEHLFCFNVHVHLSLPAWNCTAVQITDKFPRILRNSKFIIVFTLTWNWFLSQNRWFQDIN
jgi:hypothetical protein